MTLKVEELKDVVGLVLEGIDCAHLIATHGGLSLSDISYLWSVIEKVGPAFVGIDKVPAELADLDSEDCDELIQFVMEELSIEHEKSRKVIETALKALKANYEVYLSVKG